MEARHAQRIIGKVAPATEAGAGAEGISHFSSILLVRQFSK